MNILQVIPSLSPQHGGPTFVAMNLSKALADRGHRVHLVTTDRGGVADLSGLDNVTITVLRETFPVYAYAPDMSKTLESLMPNIDVVHIHALYLHPTVRAAQLARKYQVPYVIRPAGALDPYHLGRKVLKKAAFDFLVHNRVLRNASAFHFTTEVEKQISEPRTYGRRGFVVPNGLKIAEIEGFAQKGQFRKTLGEAAAKRIVLFLGRINYKKGFELLIPAFARLKRTVPDIHLVIAGNDDGHLSAVQSLIKEYGLSADCTITGFLGVPEKFEALADADVFVLPSYSENFANALFEALACGTPSVISNQVNSWPELSAAGAAVVVDTQVDELTTALHDLLASPERAEMLSNRAREFCRENYDWSTIARKLEVEYNLVLNNLSSTNDLNRLSA
ncbi:MULTISPECIES: glycosyltransferase [unclassified Bradyrhizobium]|uniref:glycosyltransferase n=1 Tax=unclassified Bradyrhizobium TaxID=2631580 RepID=UPI001FFAAB3E|nr:MULTISPECIES: glycosyltransferase [unclassified Bradyrhizobium]MCK1345783.1 glycosyltransferase [Bradyrhizobium sp. CW11]MCK1587117.1 glycosyltransferase [Bradyrhizobium sp. 169]